MSIPSLFLGARESGDLMVMGGGYDDAGDAFTTRVRSNPWTPPDRTSEGMFTAVTLWVTHRVEPADGDPSETVEVTIRAVVDEEVVVERVLTLTLTPLSNRADPPLRVRRAYEVPLSVPHIRDAIERGRNAPRGNTFQLEVEWEASDINVDGGLVEHEVVSATRQPATTPT